MVGPHLDRGAVGRQRQHADAATTFNEEVEGEPPLEHRAGRPVGGVDQRPLDLGPRCGTAGVDHPRAGVSALAGQRQEAGGLPVELHPEPDELVDPARPLVDQYAHRLLVAEPGPGGQGVGQV